MNRTLNSPPAAGVMISHYRLLEPLGSGAMGEVWLAEDTQLPRRVAVKLLSPHLARDHEATERLLREARTAASVDHPGVVAVYEAGLAEGRPYLVMQRVEGQTLGERLRAGPLEIEAAVEMARQVADALAEVHALGIVHRDLKPSNIILTARGARILDFGIASVRGAPGLTTVGATIGTPEAMSPEQFLGTPCDNRADLWALGVMLYQALTGKAPFTGDAIEAIAYRVLHGPSPPPPSTLRPGVTHELDYLVMKLLRKDPAMRYGRAEDVLVDLGCCGIQLPVATSTESAPAPATPRLAVLYFEVLSSDPDDAFLAAGLTEDLIVDLGRITGLRVASRAEVMPLRERVAPPRTLARELNSDYLLMGSVRRAGKRARISAELVRASDGHALWSDRFDRTIEDLFDVQTEVSTRIVEALQVALMPGEREMLGRAPTRNADAYAFYLQARELILVDRDSNRRAEALLRRALELDEKFALAHAALGETIAIRGLHWWAGSGVAEEARPHAERALALDPGLVDAHFVLAMLHRIKGEPEALLEAIKRVIDMDPDHPEALLWAGWSYMACGRPNDALPMLERVSSRHPDNYLAASYLVACFQLLQRPDDVAWAERAAFESVLEVVRKKPANAHARSILAIALVNRGEVVAGLEQSQRSLDLAPDDGRMRYNRACTLALAGKPELAMDLLEAATQAIPGFLVDWPRHDPDLVSLRKLPRFVKLFGEV
jgi:TolB-like protein/Tfp pilus assembly protein PilF/predicted Ser/Thr protein kinase